MTFRDGYSAKVALALRVDGQELALSHVGPGEVSLREPAAAVGPSPAQLIIQVDDSSDVLNVFLPKGIPHDACEVAYL